MSESEIPAGCAPYDEDLSAWLDGELDAGGAAVVRDHVEGCARCAARVAELRAVDDGLRAMASAAPSAPEAERLTRLRARLAEAQAQLQPLPSRAVDPAPQPERRDTVSATNAPRAAAPRRRRRWAAIATTAAAVLVAGLVLPRVVERLFTTTTEADLVMHDAAPALPTPLAAPAPVPAATGSEAAEVVAQAPPARGRFAGGASAAPGDAPEPPAATETLAVRDAEAPDDLDLAISLGELEGVAPEDLALVERLDALERMTQIGDGGPD